MNLVYLATQDIASSILAMGMARAFSMHVDYAVEFDLNEHDFAFVRALALKMDGCKAAFRMGDEVGDVTPVGKLISPSLQVNRLPWFNVTPCTASTGINRTISRSLINHGNDQFWNQNAKTFEHDSLFIGSHLEYMAFKEAFRVPELKWYMAVSALDAAEMMASVGNHYGNQGWPSALAIGLGVAYVYEIDRNCGNEGWKGWELIYKRHNGVYI